VCIGFDLPLPVSQAVLSFAGFRRAIIWPPGNSHPSVDSDRVFPFDCRTEYYSRSMSYELRNTIEILITIVLPLLALYLKGGWPLRSAVISLLCLPALWYITYAPIHELSHVAGAYLVGGTVTEYKLIPRFWIGEFGRAWITTAGIPYDWHQLIMTSAPYLLDLLCLAISIRFLRPDLVTRPFLVGLAFLSFCLRPAFDLVCETVAFVLNDKGDFYHLSRLSEILITWSFILFSLGLATFSIVIVLNRYRHSTASEPSPAT